jgi:transposase
MVCQEYTYAYGAVNIMDGQWDSLILPQVNTVCMQIFLDEISGRYPEERIVMVLDGARWHKNNGLKLPENMRLLPLAPYSPELNLVENIWEELRKKNFHNQVFASLDILETHLLQVMKDLEETPDTTKSIASWPWIINAILT